MVKGLMTSELEVNYKKALDVALEAGYEVLKQGGRSLDAVEVSVKHLEDTHLFNAGKGSVFTAEGTHEMDAAIMDGKELQAGAVSLITGIRNPVALARDVMEKSDHVSVCPWKGDAKYYDVIVDENRNPNAAWYYPIPKEGSVDRVGQDFANYVAFWNGVDIVK